MPDPVTAATAASAPAAIGTGVSAIVLAVIGVDLQAVAVGLTGSTLGLTFAAPTSAAHAVARYVASSIASAVSGTAIGQYLGQPAPVTNAIICACGVVMHLALAWIGGRFGIIADSGLRRVGIDPQGTEK
jgi:hypothetical protein